MRFVLSGGNGQLAKIFYFALIKDGHDVTSLSKAELDITNERSIKELFEKTSFDCFINCAAITNLELAEKDSILTYAVNALSLEAIGYYANLYKKKVIHLSTNYVFDGSQKALYREIDEPNPQSTYAESKFAGEKILLSVAPENALVLRLSWVFSEVDGCNFLLKLLANMRKMKNITVVNDQFGGPTAAIHVVKIVEKLSEKLTNGQGGGEIFHYCDSPAGSWYSYAENILSMSQSIGMLSEEIGCQPISSDEYTSQYSIMAVKRPINGVLNCEKICKFIGLEQFNWQNGLIPILANLNKIERNKSVPEAIIT